MASSLSAPLAAAVEYPSSDGKPMAESDSQRIPLTYAVDRLRYHFRNHADMYASGNPADLLRRRDPRARAAPVFSDNQDENPLRTSTERHRADEG